MDIIYLKDATSHEEPISP